MKDIEQLIDEVSIQVIGRKVSDDMDSNEYQLMAELANQMIDFCIDNIETKIDYDCELGGYTSEIDKRSLTKFKL